MKSSIKSKALVFLVAVPFVLITALAVMLFVVEFNKDLRNASAMLSAQSENMRETIHLEVSRGLELLRTIAANPVSGRVVSRMSGVPGGLDNDDYAELEEFAALREMLDSTSRDTSVDLVYVASTESSGLILGRDVQLATGFDVRTRDYYIDAVKTPGTFVMSQPRVSAEQSAEPIIVITAARTVAMSDGAVSGIVAFNYRLTPIIALIKEQMAANAVEIALYDTRGGYVLWNRSGDTEYFYDPKAIRPLSELLAGYGYEGTAAEELGKALLNEEGHAFTAVSDGKEYLAQALRIPDTRWALIVRFPKATIVSRLLTSILPPLALFISVFLLAQLAIYFLVMLTMIKPLAAISRNLEALAAADADLTVTLPHVTKDEIGQVAQSFNQFTGKLRDLMVDVKNAIDRTNTIKQNVSASTEETSSAIEEISANLGSIQKQIEILDLSIGDNVSTIELITRNIVQVDDRITSQSAMVEQSTSAITQMMASLASVSAIARTKQKTTAALTQIAADSSETIAKTADTFKSLVEQINQIQEMAKMINSIAAQTNLLSMNAAIEAAHAGDAGRGFAVVAEEIRKLADSSGRSSGTIAKAIKDIAVSVKLTDQHMMRTSEAFRSITDEVGSTVNAFTEIEQAVSELNLGGKQILDAINEINDVTVHIREGSSDIKAGTGAMLGSSTKIKEVSDRVTTGMAEATMGSAEIVRSMQLLVGQSQDLSSIVEDLRQKFGRFKTE
ncbi:MAG: hypothetical protein A2Y38_08280 [Spirochaetes bacterium GWB1_59_5]|nr:MAG: hypothetical protein A2Y38_08280 [Spirochaetes bacterium GWB1_59_5]